MTRSDEKIKIGLALSGGGSRAIAFHLGSMRAMHEVGLLDKVSVVSTVSGGSVIGAMWSYSTDSFEEFEERVVRLLKRGLVRDILAASILPSSIGRWLATMLICHPVNVAALALRLSLTFLGYPFKKLGIPMGWVAAIQPPLCRWVSRTTALEMALDRRIFKGVSMGSPRRREIDIVVNACEMRTGTAFRFGSRAVANYLLGKAAPDRVAVATAVAASAAFPLLLPALDVKMDLEQKGEFKRVRVLLTDGGVYDNLGTSALQGGKDPAISSNSFELDYVICSSAGQGRPEALALPYGLLSRLIGVSSIQFRKLQEAGLSMLHAEREAGRIKGFALAYLAQRDERVQIRSPEWVDRSQVVSYPTNFSAMSETDLSALAGRGRQLMLAILAQHCPELLPAN